MKLLFICLGNICRSPMAETIMRSITEKAKLADKIEIDSAGLIGYHEGEMSDPRMISHAKRRGYKITHISRKIRRSDFEYFDKILCMDDHNFDKLKDLAETNEETDKIERITDYCTRHVIDHVPDPYYGGAQGFENVIDILEDACSNLLNTIIEEFKKEE